MALEFRLGIPRAMARPKKRIPDYRPHGENLSKVWWEGRWIYLGQYNSPESLQKYRELIATIKLEPAAVSTGELLVNELLADYLEAPHEVSHDQRRMDRRICKLISEKAGSLPVSRFGPLRAAEIREDWVRRHLRTTTIRQYYHTLLRIFTWGVSQEKVGPEVLASIRSVRSVKASANGAKAAETVEPVDRRSFRLTRVIAPDSLRRALDVLYLTGARPSELLRLRPCDIHFSSDIWIYRLHEHKNKKRNKVRVIFFGPRAQRVLKPLLDKAEPDGYVFNPLKDGLRAKEPRYFAHTLFRRLEDLCVKAGVEHWFTYQLRHSAATRIKKRVDVAAAKAMLGHSSASMTQRYLSEEEREDQPLHRAIASKWG